MHTNWAKLCAKGLDKEGKPKDNHTPGYELQRSDACGPVQMCVQIIGCAKPDAPVARGGNSTGR